MEKKLKYFKEQLIKALDKICSMNDRIKELEKLIREYDEKALQIYRKETNS